MKMIAELDGIKVKIPSGYHYNKETGTYMNGHGVEYQLVRYGGKEDGSICLETIYSRHVRTVELEVVHQERS